MASSRDPSNGNRSGGRGRASSTGSRKTQTPPQRDLRSDIYGISLTVLAVALMIAVLIRGEGIVPDLVEIALGLTVGIGRYIVPFVVLAWALTFFFERFEFDELRIGGGLTLAFVAIISMIALAVPDGPLFFHPVTLIRNGGYVGAGVAYALGHVLGTIISYVVLLGVLVIGVVLATGTTVMEAWEMASAPFRREEAHAEPLKRGRVRGGGKTLPLEDLDTAPEKAAAPVARPAAARDPQADRKTAPTTRTATARRTDGFVLPPLSMLNTTPATVTSKATEKELKNTGLLIEQTLATFDIPARVEEWVAGPTVTLFEVRIAKGIKVNRVTQLSDDLALALAAPTVRVLAPIPGKSLIGIEVPNERRSTVTLGDILVGAQVPDHPLLLGIGKDIAGERVILDLAGMPHMLIAGSTGTGKSVCINAILCSLIMRATPAEVRLILIDPKRIELSVFNGIPHLYVPVVTEAKEAASALAWAVSEMERRLRLLQKAGARNIAGYNASIAEMKPTDDGDEPEHLPYLVIVIDELADLMMVAAREVEDSICRLAQLARAAGIHLCVATQRPSTDIITGLIKTNITHRIAFMVGSSIDSRVILDQPGAEKLVGLGDMLLSTPALAKPKRIQGALVSDPEVERIVEHLRGQAEPDYHEEILHVRVAANGGGIDSGEDDDPLIWEAADIVVTSGMGSTSLLQRRLKVGYARAGRIMDMLEMKGIVGPPDGSKPREVMADVEELESIKAFERRDSREADEA